MQADKVKSPSGRATGIEEFLDRCVDYKDIKVKFYTMETPYLKAQPGMGDTAVVSPKR